MALIEVKNFRKSFHGKSVHRNVCFEVHEGECLGIVGGSGVGKSVILRSLIGLEKADSGSIWIEGENIVDYNEEQLIPIRKKVAYVFQNGALFDSMTVYDNLAYMLREHTKLTEDQIYEKIQNLLAQFNLTGHDEKYPGELSGGMQKRVGLARSIIFNPRVILYDEPTAGLDPANTRNLQDMMLRLKTQGLTSLFVTHDMPSAFAVCDRLVLIKEGTVAATADIDTVKNAQSGLFYEFVNGTGRA